MEETKKCPYCGGEIMATAKKCKHCKQWLNEKQSLTEPIRHQEIQSYSGKANNIEPQSDDSESNNRLWIGLLVAGAIIILLFYWGFSKSSSKDTPIETDVELANMSSDSQSHYYVEEDLPDETESKEDNNSLSEEQDEEDAEKMIYTIKERITNIYKKAFADRSNAEELFMTDEYNRYYRKITRYETEINEPLLWDSDHWTLSQDPLNPRMEILDVNFTDDNTADVSIRIIDYDGNKINNVLLKMVYERNDWYIDDMIKSGYSEKQEMKNCIREYNID